jgi:hypothetical protein
MTLTLGSIISTATSTWYMLASLHRGYAPLSPSRRKLNSHQITNYTALVDECSHILRPGGLVILMESEFLIADEHGRPIRPTTSVMEAPWLPRWMAFVNMAIKHRGGDIEAGASSSDIVAHHPAFEEVCARDVYIGVSPWMVGDSEDARFRRWAATQMRADMKVRTLQHRVRTTGLTRIVITRSSCCLRDRCCLAAACLRLSCMSLSQMRAESWMRRGLRYWSDYIMSMHASVAWCRHEHFGSFSYIMIVLARLDTSVVCIIPSGVCIVNETTLQS